MNDNLYQIKTRNELIKLIHSLVVELKDNPDNWQHNDLPSYLEAMASWIEDMDGFYENMNRQIPNDIDWSVFADILRVARIYE